MTKPKRIKLKKCKVCTGEFKPRNTTQVVCSPICAVAWTRLKKKKAKEKANRKAVRDLRANDRSYRLAQAQMWFNKFIRLRDRNENCISCGKTDYEIENTIGGKWDCGHFRSVGSCPELRFEEKNAYKQCKSCNGGSGKYTRKNYTVSQEYEERLAKRVGQDIVDWLNGPHKAKHYTIDDLWKIERYYKKKCKELESYEFTA